MRASSTRTPEGHIQRTNKQKNINYEKAFILIGIYWCDANIVR